DRDEPTSALADRASGREDLLTSRRRQSVDLDRELDRNLAGAEHLDELTLADRALGNEVLDRDRATLGVELGQAVEVHDLVLGAERVLEPAQLGKTHVQGHLAALERRRHLVARLRALGTATRRLALRRLTATHSGLCGARAGSRTQVVDLEQAAGALGRGLGRGLIRRSLLRGSLLRRSSLLGRLHRGLSLGIGLLRSSLRRRLVSSVGGLLRRRSLLRGRSLLSSSLLGRSLLGSSLLSGRL